MNATPSAGMWCARPGRPAWMRATGPAAPRSLAGLVLLILLAVAVTLRAADSNAAESSVFTFDTRDNTVNLAAESAVFSFDTRAVDGLRNTATSGLFSFDTRGVNLASLVVSGAAFVDVGPSYPYTVKARFGDGSETDVTSQVRWSDTGWPRRVMRPDGTLTVGFDDPVNMPLTLRAQYVRPDRGLTG